MRSFIFSFQVKTVELLAEGRTSEPETGDGRLLAKKAIANGLAAIEAIVSLVAPPSSHLFAAGTDTPSVADICLVPQVYNAKRFEIDLAPFPSIAAVIARCEGLAAFIKAAPENQPDAVK
jgi:glutathione S-transferase